MPQQKRPAQGPKRRPAPAARSSNMQRRRAVSRKQNRRLHALITLISVSYTHLTLPTT